jgi:acetyltransferase-like isoleucine patch superfamily enzyme
MSLAHRLIELPATLRGYFYRASAPLFFRKVGQRTKFYGGLRIPRPFGRITIGADCMIGYQVFMQAGGPAQIAIGDACSINSNCHIVAAQSISIGDRVAIAELVSIRDSEHRFHPDHGVRGQGFNTAPVVIEDNVWIGRGSYIGPGSHIGRGSIVGANSVVRGTFPRNSLIAGAPAIVKKSLTGGE